MRKTQSETLKEHVKGVQERLKKLKNGTAQVKVVGKKSYTPLKKENSTRNTKKT